LTGGEDLVRNLSRLIRFASFALLIAAVVQELRKPAAERTWQGRVFDFVPYDLRPPTPSRFLAVMWNPDNPNILVPTAFGVGWTINFRAANNLLREMTSGM
jgi:hypothetical protein